MNTLFFNSMIIDYSNAVGGSANLCACAPAPPL